MPHIFIFFLEFICILSLVNGHDLSQDELTKLEKDLAQFGPQFLKQFLVDSGIIDVDDGAGEWREGDGLDTSGAAECLGCKTVLGSLMRMVENGLSLEEILVILEPICIEVTASMGYNGNIMCMPLMEIQGPHLLYVMNTTTYTTDEICGLVNFCDYPEYMDTREQDAGHLPQHRKSPSPYSDSDVNTRIPGTIKLAHITDNHLDNQYDPGAAFDCQLPTCCRDYWDGQGEANYWGSNECDCPVHTTEVLLKFINSLEPDLLVFTGDVAPHTVWNETFYSQMSHTDSLVDALQQNMGNVPCYPTIGNHDMFPTNQYCLLWNGTQDQNQYYAESWRTLAGFEQEQIDSIHQMGAYTMLLKPGLRLLSYNTNYGYSVNWYNLLSKDSQEIQDLHDFVDQVFDSARANGEMIIMLGHHLTGFRESLIWETQYVADVTTRNSDILMLYLQGHKHRDRFRMTTDLTTGQVYAVHSSGGTSGIHSDYNPSVRIYYLHPVTFVPLDYDVYYINMTKAGDSSTEPEVEWMYTMREEYNMTDLTPASYQDLVERMETDDDLFWRYKYNYYGRQRYPSDCDAECKAEELCELRTSSYDLYMQCLATTRATKDY